MNKQILFGLLGEKLSHSLSPLMFNHYFERFNPGIRYKAFSLTSNDLLYFLEKIRTSDMIGLNVTVPFKEKVIPYLDELSQEAEDIGAVNVILNDKGILKGYNTDYLGFMKALEKYKSLKIESAVVLGAGGASRSIIYALCKINFRTITFFSRREKKITKVQKHFYFIPRLNGCLWEKEKIKEKVKEADIVVNTTPVGMFPSDKESPVDVDCSLKNGCIACDLIYNPKVTKFLKAAQSKGAIIENGLRMLIYQAVESLKIWKGVEIDEEFFIQTSEEVLNASLSKCR